MLLNKEPRLTSRVSAFAVTPDMRDKLDYLANSTGLSIGEILRRSVSLFLNNIANEISNTANQADIEEQSA